MDLHLSFERKTVKGVCLVIPCKVKPSLGKESTVFLVSLAQCSVSVPFKPSIYEGPKGVSKQRWSVHLQKQPFSYHPLTSTEHVNLLLQMELVFETLPSLPLAVPTGQYRSLKLDASNRVKPCKYQGCVEIVSPFNDGQYSSAVSSNFCEQIVFTQRFSLLAIPTSQVECESLVPDPMGKTGLRTLCSTRNCPSPPAAVMSTPFSLGMILSRGLFLLQILEAPPMLLTRRALKCLNST